MTVIKNHLADGFVRAVPHAMRAVLIYGPDRGLASERARAAAASFAGVADDPFAVARLEEAELRADPARLADEVLAIPLFGGRRVVWARPGAADITAALEALAGRIAGEVLLLVEAGDLKPASGLRKLFEKAPDWAAIPCYADSGRDLDRLISDMMARFDLTIEPDARAHLAAHLGADRLATRLELEKLALYAHGRGTVTLDDVAAVSGDASTLETDTLLDACGLGDVAAMDRALQRLLAAGRAPAEIAGAALRHFLLLHELRCAADAGRRPADAVAALRPPVFFKRKDAMVRQCQAWSLHRLNRALDILHEAERQSRLMDTIGLAPDCVGRALLAAAVMARTG